MTGTTFTNPILPGSHPDPSICRKGADYYLATSTFEYFPGIALHHSRDLVHWRPIGHVLTRPEQLNLDRVRCSAGLYAPTIRYADGTFYVVCTLVEGGSRSGNFLVTATDPGGPWSNPQWLEDAGRFDPSLFFDDDGVAWYCSTSQDDPAHAPGMTTVALQRLDIGAGRLVGDRRPIWRGALRDSRWAEAPHIFRIGGHYYLIAAEGGTWLDHAVVAARADCVTGPYESCPRNPVLTARMAGPCASVVATGHADLVQTPAGDWWAVLLGVRPLGNGSGNLGRESFLTPVEWDADGWPVFGTDGRVRLAERHPDLDAVRWPALPRADAFTAPALGPTWLFLRTPRESWWAIAHEGTAQHLRLRLRPPTLEDADNVSFIGRRQQHHRATAYTVVDVVPQAAGECAGLAVLHSGEHQLRLEVAGADERVVRLLRRAAGATELICQRAVHAGPVGLGVEIDGDAYAFRVRDNAGNWLPIGTIDGSTLSYSVAGGFFGVVIGMYATSSGADSKTYASFTSFEYAEVAD